ncbi:hypothetical protein P7K49_023806, partial [Saguinus oedipus]
VASVGTGGVATSYLGCPLCSWAAAVPRAVARLIRPTKAAAPALLCTESLRVQRAGLLS